MTRMSRILLAALCVALIPASASAQTRTGAAAVTRSIYPGSILVMPQREDYKAPAIYRSREKAPKLEGPMAVKEICQEDIRAMMRSNRIEQKNAAASGWQTSTAVSAGVAGSLDFVQAVKVDGSAKFEYLAKVETGPLQVFYSEDDNIGRTVLRHIKDGCREIIAKRLGDGMIVFVAEEAVQAEKYQIELERHAAGTLGAQAQGRWCFFWCAKGEIVGKYDEKSSRAGSGKPVTIALVPADIGEQRYVTYADIGVDPRLPATVVASTEPRPRLSASDRRRAVAAARRGVGSQDQSQAQLDTSWFGQDTQPQKSNRRARQPSRYAMR